MTTAGAYGFVIDGVEKITYHGMDSYPTWLGAQMMQAIRTHGIEPLKEAVSMLEIVDGDDMPNKQQISEYFHYSGKPVEEISDWCDLLLNTVGDITVYLKGVKHIVNAHEFMADAVSCRWAYIINFDTCGFEIYIGGNNMNPHALGRYAVLQSPENIALGYGFDKVYGVELIREIHLEVIVKMDHQYIMGEMSDLYNAEKHSDKVMKNANALIELHKKSDCYGKLKH